MENNEANQENKQVDETIMSNTPSELHMEIVVAGLRHPLLRTDWVMLGPNDSIMVIRRMHRGDDDHVVEATDEKPFNCYAALFWQQEVGNWQALSDFDTMEDVRTHIPVKNLKSVNSPIWAFEKDGKIQMRATLQYDYSASLENYPKGILTVEDLAAVDADGMREIVYESDEADVSLVIYPRED